MNVDSTEYESSHGKSPRGRGYWIFSAGRRGAWTQIQVVGERTYAEAKKEAIAQARGMGCSELVVCP